MSDRFELTTTAPTLHRPSLSARRYNPFDLAVYFTAALALPLLAAALGYLIVHAALGDWWGALLGLVTLPASLVVGVWTWRAARVELVRLEEERLSLCREDLPPVETVVRATSTSRLHLRLGLMQNGRIVAPADDVDPALLALRGKCLTLVRAGIERGKWSRSELAEGDGAPMSGQDWDEASAELQHLGLMEVKAGRGGGLRPARDVADIIARLEVAR